MWMRLNVMQYKRYLSVFFMEGGVTICQGQDFFSHKLIYSYAYIKRFIIVNKPLDVEIVNFYYKHMMVLYQDKYRTIALYTQKWNLIRPS
jgi:hypothetical protein